MAKGPRTLRLQRARSRGKAQRRIVTAWIWNTYAQDDLLAYMHFRATHRAKLHSTSPIERPNGEIKRRTGPVGIFPNEAAVLASSVPSSRRARDMTLETIGAVRHTHHVSLSAVPA